MTFTLEKKRAKVVDKPVLQGKNIFLEGLSDKHISQVYADWLNDREICKENRHGRIYNTLEMTREYVHSVDSSDSVAVFAIMSKSKNRHIGNISLNKISWDNNSAEIAIIIGEKDFWGKGIATEAYKLIIEYAFNDLDIHRVYSGMTVRNKAMIKVAKKSGMSKEGILKDDFYKDGKYANIARFGLINPRHKKYVSTG